MKIKYFIYLALVIILTGCTMNKNDKITIMTTNFPSYDFVRAIVGDSDTISVEMLLKPGAEMHDFEPTPKDIGKIDKSRLFIYTGGDSDEWVDDILKDINTKKTKQVKMMDIVNLVIEEHKEGMESDEEEKEEEEYDEHVWTSLENAIIIIDYLKDEIIKIDPDNKDIYEANAKKYIDQIKEVDNEFKQVVSTAKRKEIIFGDRFPLRYFTLEYGLDYYAAFPGCSEQTEASAKTISFLINKVKEDNIPVVFKVELSSGKIADTIAKESNSKVLEFNSAHNISKKDFDKGITYVDIMKSNVKVLKEALN